MMFGNLYFLGIEHVNSGEGKNRKQVYVKPTFWKSPSQSSKQI